MKWSSKTASITFWQVINVIIIYTVSQLWTEEPESTGLADNYNDNDNDNDNDHNDNDNHIW